MGTEAAVQHLRQKDPVVSLSPVLSAAGKQGCLWEMLSLHCGFTAAMSTGTILVHLTAWPYRTS